MALAERPRTILATEATPQYKLFEGISIQWDKVPWNFEHPKLEPVSIDTYSIWNSDHHEEIADRLSKGQRCALYMMGNFGVAEVRGERTERASDPIFENIKQRDRMQTLVAFANPDDIGEYIDVERLPDAFKHLQNADKRRALYLGPMHVILPIKEDKIPDLGQIRDEKEAAFFWIPGHFGYEQLSKKVKEKINGGVLAGGSLNIHGQEPSFTTLELRYREMAKNRQWQENIDFVILDEIAEAEGIGRSHTQVSFTKDPPQVIRRGSMSPEKISRHTGYSLTEDGKAKLASSKTPYDETNNVLSDQRVEAALAQMARYKTEIQK